MGFKINRKTAEESCARDSKGKPIKVGDRVHVGQRIASLSTAPVSGYSGQVEKVYRHAKHGWVIEVREFETWARRDAKATAARVQTGRAAERHRLDQEVFDITKAKAKKMLAAAAKEARKA